MLAPVLPDLTPLSLDLEVATETEAILAVAGLLAGRAEVTDAAGFTEAVLERQRVSPPLLGNSIALPHARTPKVKEIVFAIGRCTQPVPFGPAAAPVQLIFLFGVPPHRISEYLAATAALARRLRDPAVVQALLAAPDEAAFRKELM